MPNIIKGGLLIVQDSTASLCMQVLWDAGEAPENLKPIETDKSPLPKLQWFKEIIIYNTSE